MTNHSPDEPATPPGGSSSDAPPPSSAVDPAPTTYVPRVRDDAAPGAGASSGKASFESHSAATEVMAAVPEQDPRLRGTDAPIPDILLTPPTIPEKRRRRDGRRATRRRRIMRRVLGTLAALLVVAIVGAWLTYRHFDGNIQAIPGLDRRPTSTPTFDPVTGLPATNILLIGSDTRAGTGDAKYGDPSQIVGARSDVQMIAHLSADRKFATIVSIPRDTMVKGPADCRFDSPKDTWKVRQFNEFFDNGGAPCSRGIVEAMTGVTIDEVAMVDFAGFKDMVNAIGTVPVCLTKPVKDKESGANFPAGRQRLDGEQALAFVRVRYNVGDGSDIGRIKRQQDFLSSMIREVTSSGVLLNPGKLFPFVNAATKSLKSNLGLSGWSSLAASVREMDPKNISFVSMPWTPYPPQPAKVMPSPAAANVWKQLRDDEPWPGTPAAKERAAASGSASPTPSMSITSSAGSPSATAPAVLPSAVSVDVVNATGLEGYGKQTAEALTAQGFVVRSTTSATTVDGVVIHHSAADKAKAQALAAAFDNPVLKPDGIAGQALRLEVGLGASKVKLVPNAPAGTSLPAQAKVAPPKKTTVEAKTADEDICTDTSGG